MKSFRYLQPRSVKEAADILSKNKLTAVPYAGGTDALSLIKFGIYQPEVVVNLKNIPGLNLINYKEGEGLRIGALMNLVDIAGNEIIKNKFSVLAEAAGEVASPQLRNMGTIGGNLCQRPRCWYYRGDFNCIRKGGDDCFAFSGENKYHCIVGGGPCFIVHPSDTAVALLALDAKITIESFTETKSIPIKDFFVDPETDYTVENILKPGEIVTEIFIPEPGKSVVSGYYKFKEREAWDFAVVSVAAVINTSGNKVRDGKITFGGVAPIPWTDEELNSKLPGLSFDDESVKSFTKNAFVKAEPLEKNQYKITLARNLIKKLLMRFTESSK